MIALHLNLGQRNPYLDIMELDMHLNLENKSYLDLGLQVLLLMLLMVLNSLLLRICGGLCT